MSCRRSWGLGALCLVAATIVFASAAAAATYYVSPEGDDGAAGTDKAPFKTIMRGVIRLQSSDTLAIAAGKYKEAVIVSIKASEDAPVAIVCQNGMSLEPAAGDGLVIKDSSYLNVLGFRVAGAEQSGIVVSGSNHIDINGCFVADSGVYGVRVGLCDFVTVQKSAISGSKARDGVFISATDHPSVIECDISGNAASGIYLSGNMNEGGDGMITGANILRNKIRDNGRQGGAAIRMDGVERSLIERNVVDHNYAAGIVLYRSDAAHGGVGDRFIGNMVRFPSGAGTCGIALRNGSYRATITDSIIAIDNGPSIEIDNTSAKGLAASNNFYPSPGKPARFGWKGEIMDFNGWQSASGQDADSHAAVVDAGYGPGAAAPRAAK